MTTLTQGLYSVRYIKRIDCNTKVKRGLELRRKTIWWIYEKRNSLWISSSNRRHMLCAQNSGIAREETSQVGKRWQKCKGHSTTVFCKISVRRRKHCVEFSITWGRLNISSYFWMSVQFMYNFEARLINSLRFPGGYFSHWLFLYKKGNLKFSDSKMWWKEESEKFSPS